MSGLRQGALTIGILLLASCGGSSVDGRRPVRLAGDCYRIPEWNAIPNAVPGDRSITLQLSSTEVARSVPGYRASGSGVRPRLLAGIFFPTEQERAQQRLNKKRAHHDIWYALGDYRARALEPISSTSLSRVYPLAGGNTWMVVTRAPDTERRDSHLQDDFWIATCNYLGTEQARRCSLDVDVGAASVSLHIAEAEVPLRQNLARHVVATLKAWQVPCDS